MFLTEIYVKGKISPDWADWFEDMQLQADFYGNTILCGDLRDISAVYGILSHLSSLGIPLISVKCRQEIDILVPEK